MNKLKVVISNTYKEQIKSKSFIIMILAPIILAAVVAIIGYFVVNNTDQGEQNEGSDFKIAIVTKQAGLANNFRKQYQDQIVKSVDSQEKAQKALKNGKIDGYLHLYTKDQQINLQYNGKEQIDDQLKKDLMTSISQEQKQLNVKHVGLNQKQLNQLSISPKFVSHYHKSTADQAKAAQQGFLSSSNYVYVFIMFFITITYSSIIATSIAKDKGSKIAEFILSSVDSFTYFLGKVIATILMLLTQLMIYMVIGLIAYKSLMSTRTFGSMIHENSRMVEKIIHNMFGFNLLYFILGSIIIILMSAISGALVSKVEDSSKAAQPVTLFIVLCFYINIFLGNSSDTLFFKIVSYLPVVSTFTMNTRIANDNVSLIEILVSLLISLIFIVICLYWVKVNYKGLLLKNDDAGLIKKIKNAVKYK